MYIHMYMCIERNKTYLQWREHDCQVSVAAAGDHVSGVCDYSQPFFLDQVHVPLPAHV